MPNGSYQGTHDHHVGRPQQGRARRDGPPRRAARRGRRRRGGGRGRAGAGPRGRRRARRRAGPPATSSSVPGQRRQGGDHVVDALAGDQAADDHEPVAAPAGRRGRSGRAERRRVDAARHDRHPVGVAAEGGELVDLVASTSPRRGRPRAGAGPRPRTRAAGLVSALALVAPLHHAEGVERLHAAAAGRRAPAGPARAAHPDIQKWACTTSGGRAAHRRRSARGEVGHVRPQLVLGDRPPGAGDDVLDLARPGAMRTRGGRSGASARVDTVTSQPRPARWAASAATWTFCPPASASPSDASGLACSETSSTRSGLIADASACGRTGRDQPVERGDDVGAGHVCQAHLLVERARAAAAAGAGHVPGRRGPRAAPATAASGPTGTVAAKRDHDRRADGGGQVHRAGVAAHDSVGAGEHGAELAQGQASSEIDHIGRLPENRFGETRFFPTARHGDAPSRGGARRAPPSRHWAGGQRAGRDAGSGVHDDVGARRVERARPRRAAGSTPPRSTAKRSSIGAGKPSASVTSRPRRDLVHVGVAAGCARRAASRRGRG